MSIDIRLPQISGTEKEMLLQIRSYLYQLAPQLQWALEDINKRQETFSPSDPQRSIVQSVGVSNGTSNASPQDTFASIKALIIKSADIVNAYYEEISRKLVGDYEAYSDFGDFIQHTESTITETSEKINASFSNIQTIGKNVSNLDTKLNTEVDNSLTSINGSLNTLENGLNDAKGEMEASLEEVKKSIDAVSHSLKEARANIESGVLRYDDNGYPIYGIKVGQVNEVDGVEVFNKFAEFASDKLSFFDKDGVEVAYISDFKLHITNAEITDSLKIGGFLFDKTNGLAVKWVGG